MVATYTIFGRQVGSHVVSLANLPLDFARYDRNALPRPRRLTQLQLAMITLGTTFSVAALSMGGGDKKKAQAPPINASSKEEEQFIQ